MQTNAAVGGGGAEFGIIAGGGAVDGVAAGDENGIGHIAETHIITTGEFFGVVFGQHRAGRVAVHVGCFILLALAGGYGEAVF